MEKTQNLIDELNEAIYLNNYEKIIEIGKELNLVNDKNENYYLSCIFNAYIKEKMWESLSDYCEELNRRNKESYLIINYYFLSLMKLDDYYRIKSFISRSKWIDLTIQKQIIDGEYAVFDSLKQSVEELTQEKNEAYALDYLTCALLVLYINDLFTNFDIDKTTKEDKMIAYYEMMDLAYSNGLSIKQIETIDLFGKELFQK